MSLSILSTKTWFEEATSQYQANPFGYQSPTAFSPQQGQHQATTASLGATSGSFFDRSNEPTTTDSSTTAKVNNTIIPKEEKAT